MLAAADVAHRFLSIVWADEVPDIETLARAIDCLLAQSYDVVSGDCTEEDAEPPSIDGNLLYQDVANRFPYLGFYPFAHPLASIDADRMMGDGVDDLADITRDLREVVWWSENYGLGDAAFCFRLLCPHWGRHARGLSMYLHAQIWG